MIEKLHTFFEHTTALCHGYSRRQFPAAVTRAMHAWSNASREAATDQGFLEYLNEGLTALTRQNVLGDLIERELDAVLVLQTAALNGPDFEMVRPAGGAPPFRRTPAFRLPARAIRASKSLLGSFREVLRDLVPDWVLGILKVFEEITEIYGPAN